LNIPPWAQQLLQAPVGHLATTGEDSQPAVVPVCFVLDDDIAWSVIDEKPKSSRDLKRLRNIRENPRFALLVDRYDNDWSRLAWVQLIGRADVVSALEHPEIIGLLRQKYPQYRQMDLETSLLIRMDVERVVSWRASLG
jgi:PPOX class probable F420-dependent enzyme